uniref:Uncharacterized protein n=1 Tax=Phanerochaete carnosa TaxID=231932 RepID=A0A895KX52_9APHY|nr:hypothetical protein K8K84_mgp068 [Phanerochaete carnosa]QRZ60384.1 hypothetical protein [Phanerochaete carnosa]
MKHSFEADQLKSDSPNRSYYPYTVYNKYDSWTEYIKKVFSKESELEFFHRTSDLKTILNRGTTADLEMSPVKTAYNKKVTFPLNLITDILPSSKLHPTTEISPTSNLPTPIEIASTSNLTTPTEIASSSKLPTPTSPLSPEQLAEAGAEVWHDHPSRSGTPTEIQTNLPSAKEMIGYIENLCRGDRNFHLYLYEFMDKSANTEYMGDLLEGTRPAFNQAGHRVPRYEHDILNFLTDKTVLGQDWYDYTKVHGVKLQDQLLALRDYIENPVEFAKKYN